MNSFYRARRSILRKPWKSLLLLFAVATLSLLFLCGLGARTATIEANDSTRQAVGASFLLEANAENRAERLEAASAKIAAASPDGVGEADGVHQEKKLVNGQEMWHTWTDNSFETLLNSDIETLAKTKGLSGYTITTAPEAVKPVGFTRIEDANTDQSADVGGVTLIGDRDVTLNSNVSGGIIALKEGRWTTSKDENVCVISQDLAKKNGLTVGDKISFAAIDGNKPAVQTTVVGIYEERQKMTPYMAGDTYRAENVIFCDLHLPERVTGEGPLYEQAVFQVSDVDAYEEVRTALQATPIDWSRYDLIDRNGNLETMAANFAGLSDVSTMMLAVVAIAGLFLLVLILAFWVRSRRHEFGVLLAIGVSKGAILRQLLIETASIAVFAMVLSFSVAPAVSTQTAQMLANAQLEQTTLDEMSEQSAVATDYVAPKLAVNSVETTLTPAMLVMDTAGVGVLVVLATVGTAGWILHKKPRFLLND